MLNANILGSGLGRGWAAWLVAGAVALGASLAGPSTAEAESADGLLRVSVSRIKHDAGKLNCLLWSSKAGFPSKEQRAYKSAWGSFSDGRGTCVFRGVPAGTYGVSLMHDENGNGKLDTNLVGMPKEGYGFSNDAEPGTFGPPDFDDVTFRYSGSASKISVRMRY